MKKIPNRSLWAVLLLSLFFAAGILAGRAQSATPAPETPHLTVSGTRIAVHYPAENRFYIYTELGGNCVFAYRLSTAGGPIERENCR